MDKNNSLAAILMAAVRGDHPMGGHQLYNNDIPEYRAPEEVPPGWLPPGAPPMTGPGQQGPTMERGMEMFSMPIPRFHIPPGKRRTREVNI